MERKYAMTDMHLVQTADLLLRLMLRDEEQMLNYCLGQDYRQLFKKLADELREFPYDDDYLIDVSMKIESKNQLKGRILKSISDLKLRLKLAFPDEKFVYEKIQTKGAKYISDTKLMQLCVISNGIARENMIALQKFGFSHEDLDKMETDYKQFNLAMEQLNISVQKRKQGTRERVELGNKLFTYVKSVASVGQEIWKYSSEAKYNDYVIYKGK